MIVQGGRKARVGAVGGWGVCKNNRKSLSDCLTACSSDVHSSCWPCMGCEDRSLCAKKTTHVSGVTLLACT